MKFLSMILIVLLSNTCISQSDQDIQMVKHFLLDINKNETNVDIGNKYIHFTNSTSRLKAQEILDLQLLSLKDSIKSIGLDNLKVELCKDISPFDLTEVSYDNLLTVSDEKNVLLYILTENKKIKSFTTIRKGGKERWFVVY